MVNDATGGDLKIDVLPRRGAVVPAFQPARRGQQGHPRRRPRRAGLLVRQKPGAGAVGLRDRATPWTPTCCSPGTSTAAAKELLAKIYQSRSAPTSSRSLTGRCYDAAARAGSRSRSPERRRHQGPQVPHRGPLDRPVPGDGRRSECPSWRRDRVGHGPRPARGGRVQQRVFGPRAWLRGRVQGVHAAELPPERRAVRDHLQQGEVQRAAGEDAGDHRLRRRGGLAGHELEGGRPLLAGLHRAADQGKREVLQDAGRDSEEAAPKRSTTRSPRSTSAHQIRCSRRSLRRSSPSPSGRRSGSRTRWSAARCPSIITGDRTGRRRAPI